jgi:hypothetical protein
MPATRSSPETILAHVDLLRAVDELLTQADSVRAKRNALNRLFSENPEPGRCPDRPANTRESGRTD